jgi:hypothetical protein
MPAELALHRHILAESAVAHNVRRIRSAGPAPRSLMTCGSLSRSRKPKGLDQDLDPGLGFLARKFGLCLSFSLCLGHGYIDREVESLGDVPSR